MYRLELPGAAALRFLIALLPDGGLPEKGDGVNFQIFIKEPETALHTERQMLIALVQHGIPGLLLLDLLWGAIGSLALQGCHSKDTAERKLFFQG